MESAKRGCFSYESVPGRLFQRSRNTRSACPSFRPSARPLANLVGDRRGHPHLPTGDCRRRPAEPVDRLLPDDVLRFAPLDWQPALAGMALSVRPAKLRPVPGPYRDTYFQKRTSGDTAQVAQAFASGISAQGGRARRGSSRRGPGNSARHHARRIAARMQATVGCPSLGYQERPVRPGKRGWNGRCNVAV